MTAILLRLPPGAGARLSTSSGRRTLRAAGARFDLEPLFSAAGPSRAAVSWEWHIAHPHDAPDAARAWEVAYASAGAASALVGAPTYAEPDLVQQWLYENPPTRSPRGPGAGEDVCVFNDQVPDLPNVAGRFAWHLDAAFTGLADARARAAAAAPDATIRIAHLDTGYDPEHTARPPRLRLDLQRNFLEGEPVDDARDPAQRGLLDHPGHGTGTLGILAGGRVTPAASGYRFDDTLGGAATAEIVPVRVANSVVQIRTSSVARGIDYAVALSGREETRVHVLSMSLGGVASAAWADAVNLAYDSGIVLVAAAGNNISAGLFAVPTRFIVYPARFHRVVAACGVMADGRPYFGLPAGTMQGNWGPDSKMATAIAAYTPNIAWPELGCTSLVDMDGSGTSSAAPQVAAAAALYLQRHAEALFDATRYSEPWTRVEATRHALFASAEMPVASGSAKMLGKGLLRATEALNVAPAAAGALRRTDPDSAMLPFLRLLTGRGRAAAPGDDAMFALEASQLALTWPDAATPNPLELAVPDPDLPAASVPASQVRSFLDGLLAHPDTSAPLRERAEAVRRGISGEP